MVIAMLYILFNILQLSIDFYKLKTLDEMKQLLNLKGILYDDKIGKGIIIYQDSALVVERILSYHGKILKTTNGYIDKPDQYIIIPKVYDFSYVKVMVSMFLYAFSIICISINLYVSIVLIFLTCFVKTNRLVVYPFLIIIVIINILIYENTYMIISIIIILSSLKINKLVYLTFLPFVFNTYWYNVKQTIIYICLLFCLKLFDDKQTLDFKLKSQSIFVKKRVL